MERIRNNSPRPNFEHIIKAEGLHYSKTKPYQEHYWNENNFYKLTEKDEAELKRVTEDLSRRLEEEIIPFILNDSEWLDYYGLNEQAKELIRRSWANRDESLYGRFDFIPVSNEPSEGIKLKLLEYNGDTPTGYLESARCQASSYRDTVALDRTTKTHQFNELSEYLQKRWAYFLAKSEYKLLHLASLPLTIDQEGEDRAQLLFMAEQARAAGWEVKVIDISDLSWRGDHWEDADGVLIRNLYKIYPWEDMCFDAFDRDENGEVTYLMGDLLVNDGAYEAMEHWFEPPWKMLFSNKVLLAVLWEYYADELDYITPAFISLDYQEGSMKNFVKKPFFGREGDGVLIEAPSYRVKDSRLTGTMTRITPEEEYVYQEYIPFLKFKDDKNPEKELHPMIGAWVGDHKLKGLSIREHTGYITDTDCLFTPHFTVEEEDNFFTKF